uniref:Protein TIFY n=1 Tax=Noccaea caerulescens TaxID=107243 RepID=A0A1J3D8B9_NOCCA
MSRNENGKAQPPEKSNFTRRCSLLSRYLKEKGSFGNIELGLVRKPDSNLGLPGNSDLPVNTNSMPKADSDIKSLDFSNKVSKAEPSTSSGGKSKNTTNLSGESEAGSSQLTIFFGGKVLVYNEFPEDKAKEIMKVAKQAKPVSEINIQTQINVENNNNKSNTVLPDLNEPTNSADINQQQQNQLVERIARRASLHRFFAKRKDRAVARAPYQVNQNAGRHHYPPKPETVPGQPLEPGQSSHRPDNAVAQTVSHPKPVGDEDFLMEVEEEGQSLKNLDLRL